MPKKQLLLLFCFFTFSFLSAQTASFEGKVDIENAPVPFASIVLEGTQLGAETDQDGKFDIKNIPAGVYTVTVKFLGYTTISESIKLAAGQSLVRNFSMQEDVFNLDGVVISGTRYEQDRVNNPIVVGVIDTKIFNATQSIAISEGLNYQPGVRVETNCQNCGFTQVRINGLEGAYSQILINSRPIFSALSSVYGLDQIPANIVEQVEVVRSGGSALYGSNAIAGTINIITKEPINNVWELGSNTALIAGEALDQTFTVNGSIVSESLNSGISIYGMRRNRDPYDANGDGFTELVKLENTVFGAKAFFDPGDRSKIVVDFSALEEFRRGGDRLELPPHFTDITEQIDNSTLFGGINFEQWSKNSQNKYGLYVSTQSTKRRSYYGGLGGGRTAQDSTLAINAYGNTKDLAVVAGFQYNHYFNNDDVLTAGIENQTNKTEDNFPGYNRVIDQTVNATGIYAQYEWKPNEKFTALLGGRLDIPIVDGIYTVGDIERSVDINESVLSPRFTLLYKANDNLRFRGGYARGFRAPQAFNEDLHISLVGGEPLFVIPSEDLVSETSNAFTASLNYTKSIGLAQMNFLLEGFYTALQNPFTQVSRGATLPNGSIVEEVVNGEGASVGGFNFEAGYSPSSKFAFQLGGTVQGTRYDEPQVLYDPEDGSDDIVAVDEFVRTPNLYGYFSTFYNLTSAFKLDLTGVYTGGMIVPRVVDQNGFIELIDTEPFFDVNFKAAYHFEIMQDFHLDLSAGVRNIFNSYQSDFDEGPERDSDYIYGPPLPRSVFISIKIGNLR